MLVFIGEHILNRFHSSRFCKFCGVSFFVLVTLVAIKPSMGHCDGGIVVPELICINLKRHDTLLCFIVNGSSIV